MKDVSIFISYSHKDELWKKRIVKHLKVLILNLNMNLNLTTWDDNEIEAGSKWRTEIFDAINNANIAVLLISADFLISEFINKKEIPLILKKKKTGSLRIFPILVKDCSYRDVKWLSNIQIRPKKPLSKFANKFIETEIKNITQEIKQLLISKVKSRQNKKTSSHPKNKINASYMLPYLINRSEQIKTIKNTLIQPETENRHKKKSNYIWIIHGEEDQCHDMFLECLQKYYWKKIHKYNVDQATLKLMTFDWPKKYEDFEDLQNQITYEIKDKYAANISNNKILSLAKRINNCHKGPIMLYTYVYTDDFKSKKENIIHDFVNLWKEWPQRGSGRFLIFCLIVKYYKEIKKLKKSMFNRLLPITSSNIKVNKKIQSVIDDYSGANHDNKCVVIPQLTSINRSDVEDWGRLPYVQKTYEIRDFTPVIRVIYSNPICSEENKLSMEALVKQLTEKLN